MANNVNLLAKDFQQNNLHIFYNDFHDEMGDGSSEESLQQGMSLVEQETEKAKNLLFDVKKRTDKDGFDINSESFISDKLLDIAEDSLEKEKEFYDIIFSDGGAFSKKVDNAFSEYVGSGTRAFRYMMKKDGEQSLLEQFMRKVYSADDTNGDQRMKLLQALGTLNNQSHIMPQAANLTTINRMSNMLSNIVRDYFETQYQKKVKEAQKLADQIIARQNATKEKPAPDLEFQIIFPENQVFKNFSSIVQVLKQNKKENNGELNLFPLAVETLKEIDKVVSVEQKKLEKKLTDTSFRDAGWHRTIYDRELELGDLNDWIEDSIQQLSSFLAENGYPDLSDDVLTNILIDIMEGIDVKKSSTIALNDSKAIHYSYKVKGGLTMIDLIQQSLEKNFGQESAKKMMEEFQKTTSAVEVESILINNKQLIEIAKNLIEQYNSGEQNNEILSKILANNFVEEVEQFHNYVREMLFRRTSDKDLINYYDQNIIEIINRAILEDAIGAFFAKNPKALSAMNSEFKKISNEMPIVIDFAAQKVIVQQVYDALKKDKKLNSENFFKALAANGVKDVEKLKAGALKASETDIDTQLNAVLSKIQDQAGGNISHIKGAIGEVFFPSFVRALWGDKGLTAEQLGSAINRNEKQAHIDINVTYDDQKGNVKQWGFQAKIYRSNSISFYKDDTKIDFTNFTRNGEYTAVKWMGSEEVVLALRYFLLNNTILQSFGLNLSTDASAASYKTQNLTSAILMHLDNLMRYGDGLSTIQDENGGDIKNHFYMINFNIIPASAVILYIRDQIESLNKKGLIKNFTYNVERNDQEIKNLMTTQGAESVRVNSPLSKNMLTEARAEFSGITINFDNLGAIFQF